MKSQTNTSLPYANFINICTYSSKRKLHMFLLSIKRDIFNLELVQDEKVELIVDTHSFMHIESLLK
jgi:hypothetical protein